MLTLTNANHQEWLISATQRQQDEANTPLKRVFSPWKLAGDLSRPRGHVQEEPVSRQPTSHPPSAAPVFLSAQIASLAVSDVAESAASQTPPVAPATKQGGCQKEAGGDGDGDGQGWRGRPRLTGTSQRRRTGVEIGL